MLLYTWLKITSNHDTLANKCTKENTRINFNRDAIVHIIKLFMYSHQTCIQLYFN